MKIWMDILKVFGELVVAIGVSALIGLVLMEWLFCYLNRSISRDEGEVG